MAGKRTPEAELTLLGLLSIGLGFESAAPAIGYTVDGLRKWRRDDEEFEDRCQAAIARGKQRVLGKLMELIDAGNDRAIIFWLKTRCEEFREQKDNQMGDAVTIAAAIVQGVDMARRSTMGLPPIVPAELGTNGSGNGHTNGNGHP